MTTFIGKFALGLLPLLSVCLIWANAPGPRRTLLFLAAVPGSLYLWREGRQILGGKFLWLMPWLVVAIFSIFWSYAPGRGLSDAMNEVVAPIMAAGLALGVARIAHFEHFLRIFLLSLVVAAALSTLGGLHAHVGFWPTGPRWLLATYPGRGVASTFGVLLSLLAFGCWLIYRQRERVISRLSLLLLGEGVLLGVLGHNRMYWFALVVGLLPWLPLLWRQSIKMRMAILVSGLLLFAGGVAYSSYFAKNLESQMTFSEAVANKYGNDPRWVIWWDWLQVAAERPWLGYGYGSRVLPKLGEEKIVVTVDPNAQQHSHNVFLNVLVQTGLVGLCAFLALLYGVFRLLAPTANSQCAQELWHYLGYSLLVGCIAKSLTDDFFWGPAGGMMWLLIGLLAGRQRIDKSD